jgi:MFS family permease
MLVAVAAMFLQQTCGSIARALPAVLAPLIITELHADAAWVGIYFSLTAFAALIGQLGSGGFIIRHGAIRMSQIALLFTGAGLAVAVIGGAAGFILSALIGNGVASVATPASSQLLGRWSVRRYAPFAFAIAQCAIPAGILLTGYLGPVTAASFGWRDTMVGSAVLCWAVALMLQPLRGRLDTEPSPRHPIRLSDFRTTITAVLAVRELRSLSFACFAFNGTQAVFVAYFVTYMTSQGHPLVSAGSLYAIVIAVALPGRILWAWVGGFYIAPQFVLGGLAFGMAASIGLFGAVTPHWPLWAVGAVAMVISATAMSWHGITLSEAARLAPQGRVGAVTGGVLSFGQIGALACPAAFSLLLGLTGGYGAGWVACAVPAILVGINMLLQGKPAPRSAL